MSDNDTEEKERIDGNSDNEDINFSDTETDANNKKSVNIGNDLDDANDINGSKVVDHEDETEDNDNDEDEDVDEEMLLRDDDDVVDKDESDDDKDLDRDSEDEDEVHTSKKSSKKRNRLSKDGKEKKKSKKSRTLKTANFFLDEADVASDEDEDEYDEPERAGFEEEIVEKDVQAARAAVAARHEKNKQFQAQSAEDIAREIEERHKAQERVQRHYVSQRGEDGAVLHNSIHTQQSFLPSVLDPKIFKVKCKPGNELLLIRAIMLKTVEVHNKGGLLKIKSAFCSDSKGFVYIEAINEAFAKEIIVGLRLLYPSSFEQIPVAEMTSVLNVSIKKKPLRINQWVRFKRGPLKGDLARIVDLFDGGEKAFVQAVPRPDYSVSVGMNDGKKKEPGANKVNQNKIRPQQRLFDAEEAKSNNGTVLRRHHPMTPSSLTFDLWNNEYYREGFLFKEVNVSTYLDESNVNPRLEELQLFRPRKSRNDEDDEDEPGEDESAITGGAYHTSFIKELAEQIAHMGEDDDRTEGVNPFMPGDLVQVIGGDLKNLVARIVSVNDMARVATIVPYNNNDVKTSFNVEIDLLVKHIVAGAHIKVVTGRYMGQTGRVVSVNMIDGVFVAAILTDGINTEIQCNVSHLQMSSEVTTGHGNLQGYELYDLITLSENETAVVIVVGAEKLRVINHVGNIKDVMPQEVQGKRNFQSAKNSGFDSQQNTLGVGDTVRVVSGDFAKQTGTIKHMMKGVLWLHSTSYLKNSGVFVIKQRQCVVAGGKTATPVLSASYRGVLTPTPVHNANNSSGMNSQQSTPNSMNSRSPAGGSTGGGGGYKIGRDPSIGITVSISKGKYKGLLGTVVDVTPTHFSVELSAKMKKIVIERTLTKPVGDKAGSFASERRLLPVNGAMDVPSTPYLTSQTPMHYAGSETPRYALGSETPMYGSETPLSSRTPRGAGEDHVDIWRPSRADVIVQQSPLSTVTPMSHSDSHISNPWNLSSASHQSSSGYGSGLSNARPPLEGFSPLNSHTSYSAAGTPLQDGGYGGGSANAPFKEWTEDMVAIGRKGHLTGKQCVVQHRPDMNGMVEVSLRESSGYVSRTTHRVHYEDLLLAEPPKKENAVVVMGKHRGKAGIVKNIVGKDVILELTGGQTAEMFKMSTVAWLNRRQ